MIYSHLRYYIIQTIFFHCLTLKNFKFEQPKQPICKSDYKKNFDGKNIYLSRLFLFR